MKAVMATLYFVLFLLFRAFASSDTVQEHVRIYPHQETYKSDLIYFEDSVGNTKATFQADVTVHLFAKSDYVWLIVEGEASPIQAVYRISSYGVGNIGGIIVREWNVIDENVAMVVMDESSNIYFVRHDGQMMVVPHSKPEK